MRWVRWAVRQRGWVGAARMGLGRLRQGRATEMPVHQFDQEYGVETSGLLEGGGLGGGHRHAEFGTAYLGVPPSRMRGVLRRWQETPGVLPIEAYTFVDVGCGKGRAVLLASELPFREAMGVELDAGLAAVAGRNAERWRALGRARCPVRIVCGDATEAALPEGPLVVYLYNPFLAPVLRGLLRRLAERETVVEVLYLYPLEEAVFAEFPMFAPLWREGIPLAAEDAGVDAFAAAEDPCAAFRLRRGASDPERAG